MFTARNFPHAFPAHIDSSSLLSYNTPHYSLVDSASPICRILESLYHHQLLESSWASPQDTNFKFNALFVNILSRPVYIENYIQSRAARMLLFRCWNAFLAHRTLCASLYVRLSLLCMLAKFFSSFCTFADSSMQNPYHRLSRFTKFHAFCFIVEASSLVFTILCQILQNIPNKIHPDLLFASTYNLWDKQIRSE